MIISTFPSGPFQTNAYIAACPLTRIAAVIDPAPGSFKLLSNFLSKNELRLERILLTHSHWDHIADAHSMKTAYEVPVCLHPLDSPNLERPGADGLPFRLLIQGVTPDQFFHDGETFKVGQLEFLVITTPGHTPGGICFYCKEENVLFSGDTLFKGSMGNVSFPGSNPEDMWNSLQKLSLLPPETKVFPGHGPTTTIGSENWLSRAKEIFGN